jgi:glycosyltransferase involved in cell wall biosynthesis
MTPISAIVITLNEERKIKRCIESLQKVAEEVIVIDSFSADSTISVCESLGIKVIQREFTSYYDQKNYGLSLAKHDYILSLDADEYLSPELTQTILALKSSLNDKAYKMSRRSSYLGKWISYGSWAPDWQLRLWNKNQGKWNLQEIHEIVVLNPRTKVEKLNGYLLHESYSGSQQALDKIQLFSNIYSSFYYKKKRTSLFGIMLHSSFAFFKSYIIKRGFLDGYEGLAVAVSMANHTFYKYAKLYELSNTKKS